MSEEGRMLVKAIRNKKDGQYYNYEDNIGWCTSYRPTELLEPTATIEDYNRLAERGYAKALPEPKEDFYLEELAIEPIERADDRAAFNRGYIAGLEARIKSLELGIKKRNELIEEGIRLNKQIIEAIEAAAK